MSDSTPPSQYRIKEIILIFIIIAGFLATETAAAAGPDIIGTKLLLSSPLTSGSYVECSDYIRNQGNEVARDFEIEYYLIINPVTTAEKIFVGNWKISELKAGAIKSGTIILSIPQEITPGEYYLLRWIDPKGEISNEKKNNNQQRSRDTFEVIAGSEELQGIGTIFPAVSAAGEFVPVSIMLQNPTETPVENREIHLFLSPSPSPDYSLVPLAVLPVPTVPPLNEITVTDYVLIPSDIRPDNYYLFTSFVSADELKSSTGRQLFWFNNEPVQIIRSTTSPTISPTLAPDSFVPVSSGVDVIGLETVVPHEAFIGDSIQITETIQNIGGAPANIVRIEYSLSPDTDGKNGRHLGWITTMGLNPGKEVKESKLLSVPSSIKPGLYYLTKKITVTAASIEQNTANNWWVSEYPVYIRYNPKDPIPDLTHVKTIWPSGQPGENVQITDTVTNIGRACADQVAVAYYLSPYPEFDYGTSYYLGVWWIDSICGLQQKTNTIDVTIPADLTNGEYYIYSIIDPCSFLGECDEGIPELEKSNNINVGRLYIGPCVFC